MRTLWSVDVHLYYSAVD